MVQIAMFLVGFALIYRCSQDLRERNTVSAMIGLVLGVAFLVLAVFMPLLLDWYMKA